MLDELEAERQKTGEKIDWRDIAVFCDATLPGLRRQRRRVSSIASRFAQSSRELDRVVDSFASISAYARSAGGLPPAPARRWNASERADQLRFDASLDGILMDATKLVRLLQRRTSAASYVPQNRTDHILGLAEDILTEENGEDMYYKTLAEEVRRRGGPLPKSDRSAYETLIRMMNTDRQKRFIRPFQRGYYALAKDHPGRPSVGVRTGGKQASAD